MTGNAYERLYRALCRLLPGHFRDMHADEMDDLMSTMLREVTARNSPASFRFWLRAYADVIGQGLAEHIKSPRVHGARRIGFGLFMTSVTADVRHGFRGLIRNPLFTLVTILVLGLGVGANTAVFSVINSVLLSSLPYDEPDRLMTVQEDNPATGDRWNVSYPNFNDWRNRQSSFEAIAAVYETAVNLRGGDEAQRVSIVAASADIFKVLRLAPILGRPFSAEDDLPEAAPVLLLSERIWKRNFGASPDVIGRTVSIDGNPTEIIGVLPAAFDLPPADVGLFTVLDPIRESLNYRSMHVLSVIGRLKHGVAVDAAEAELKTIQADIEREFPGKDPTHRPAVVSLNETVAGNLKPGLLVLFASVSLVLLIGCANVANLLLARGLSRSREFSLRAALGAGRRRIMRQLFTETLIIALLGAAAGIVTGGVGIKFITLMLPWDLPLREQLGLNGTVLIFTLLLAVLAGLAAGFVPSMRTSRMSLTDGLSERTPSGGPHAITRNVFVIAQMAMSLVLLATAGLLLKNLWLLSKTDPGFDTTNLFSATVSLRGSEFNSGERVTGFYAALTESLRAVAGVSSASAVNALPISGGDSHGILTIEGHTPFAPGEAPGVSFRRVLPNYFRTMRIPVVEGREFTHADGDGEMVVLINETMARKFWSGESPIGARIKVGRPDDEPWLRVVGVVGDVSNEGLDASPDLATYEPHKQRPWSTMNVVVRTDVPPLSVSAAVRARIREAGGDIPVFNIVTMTDRITSSLASRRFLAVLIAMFAALALVLALVGLYGVISFSVNQRKYEFGVRMALGADSRDVVWTVMRGGLRNLAAGVLLGIVGVTMVGGFLRSLLVNVSVTDVSTLVGVSVLLLVTGLLASYLPARRATSVDPATVLRAE